MHTPIVLLAGEAGTGKDTAASILQRRLGAFPVAMAAPLKDLASAVFGFTHAQLYGPSANRNAADPRYDDAGSRWWRWARQAVETGEAVEVWLLRVADTLERHSHLIADVRLYREQLVAWFDDLHRRAVTGTQLTPRLVLQTLGTEYGRTLADSIWINMAIDEGSQIAQFERARFLVITDGRFANEVDAVTRAGGFVVRLRDPEGALQAAAQAGGVPGHASECSLQGALGRFDLVVENDKRRGLAHLEAQIVGPVETYLAAQRKAVGT